MREAINNLINPNCENFYLAKINVSRVGYNTAHQPALSLSGCILFVLDQRRVEHVAG